MLYREDQDGIAETVEADAIVAGAQAEFRWLDVLEAFNVAFTGGEMREMTCKMRIAAAWSIPRTLA